MASDLLSLPLKQTASAQLEQGLLLFISTSYSHEQAEQHRPAVGEVHALRERVRAIALSEATAEDAVSALGRYAKLLTSMSSRFGTAVDDALSGTDAQLELTWRDAHKPEARCTMHQLGFERVCALYNLAAALSFRATTRNTADGDGLRAACQDFQQAAGALDTAAGAIAGASWASDRALTADISAAALEGKRALMLAQAQRCFYERATRDQMKGGVVAKLAAATSAFYDEAAAKLRTVRDECVASGGGGELSPPGRERGGGMLGKAKDRVGRASSGTGAPATLLALICQAEAGARIFDAWAQFHMAAEHEEKHEYGPQVARLQRAVELATHASERLAAGGVAANSGGGAAAGASAVPPAVLKALEEAVSTIRAAEATASKYNMNVYHERVPPISTLASPAPKAIVKPMTPTPLALPAASNDYSDAASAAEGDPFSRLVPLTVLTDASVYTASLDDLLRQMSDDLNDIQQTKEAELASMDLPDALNACEADSRLPEPLAEAVTRVQAAGGTRAVSDMLESVRGKTADLDACAMSIDALLEVEEGADQQLHLQHGERWACVRSAALTADARRELAEIRADIQQAEAANAALRSHHAACLDHLQLLNYDIPTLNSMVPRGAKGSTLADLECVADIRTLLESLRSCAAARVAALADARALAARDDVTGELVYRGDAAGGSTETVFAKALAKYEPFASRIRESAELEAELLSALRTANETFTTARTSDPSLPEREAFFHKLFLAVKSFDDLEAQLLHGLDFCAEASERLDALQSTVTSLGAARAYERTELLEALHAETVNDEARAAAAQALAEARVQQQQFPPPVPAVVPAAAAAPTPFVPPAVPLPSNMLPSSSWPPQPRQGSHESDGIDHLTLSSTVSNQSHPLPPRPPFPPPAASPPSASEVGGIGYSSLAPPIGCRESDHDEAPQALRAGLQEARRPSQPACESRAPSYSILQAVPPPMPPAAVVPLASGASRPFLPPSSTLPEVPRSQPHSQGRPNVVAAPPWSSASLQRLQQQYAPPPLHQSSASLPQHPPSHGEDDDAQLAWAMAESLKLAEEASKAPFADVRPQQPHYMPPPPPVAPPAVAPPAVAPPPGASSHYYGSYSTPLKGPSPPPPSYGIAAPSAQGTMPKIPDYRPPVAPPASSNGSASPPPPSLSPSPSVSPSGITVVSNTASPRGSSTQASALPVPTPFGAPYVSAASTNHSAPPPPSIPYGAPPPLPPGGMPASGFPASGLSSGFPSPPSNTSYAVPPPPGGVGSGALPPPPPFSASMRPPAATMSLNMGAPGKVPAPSYVPRW